MSRDAAMAGRDLQDELEKIEAQLKELNGRLPAHSVKPAMMMKLLELEERRDALLAKIQTIASRS